MPAFPPRKKNISVFLSVIAAFTFLSGCAGPMNYAEDPDAGYKRAEELFNKHKYAKTIEILDALTLSHAGSVYAEPAQMLLARSYFEDGQYLSASAEFRRFTSSFPKSEMREEALYMIARSNEMLSPRPDLEQKYTNQAIDLYNDFLNEYPSSEFSQQAKDGIARLTEKLARKECNAIYIYTKLKDWDSVVLYTDLLLEDYPDAACVPEALYYKANALDKKGETDDARALYEQITKSYDSGKFVDKAAKRLKKLGD